MGLIHVWRDEETFVGGDQWQIVIVSKIQKVRFDLALDIQSMPHQFHIKTVRKNVLERSQELFRMGGLALPEQAANAAP